MVLFLNVTQGEQDDGQAASVQWIVRNVQFHQTFVPLDDVSDDLGTPLTAQMIVRHIEHTQIAHFVYRATAVSVLIFNLVFILRVKQRALQMTKTCISQVAALKI